MMSSSRSGWMTWVAVVAVVGMFAGTAGAATINVPADQPNIQAAINAAVAGDTVLVANGTYNITAEIAVNKAITLRSVNGAAVTIVRAAGATVNARIFVVTADATVDGFTMREAKRVSGNVLGGGVFVNSANAVVQNCIMTANVGDTMYGDGAYVVAGTVQNCTISGNGFTDRVNGGGVYMTGGTVKNCTITGNGAGNGGGTGGGVYMTGGTLL